MYREHSLSNGYLRKKKKKAVMANFRTTNDPLNYPFFLFGKRRTKSPERQTFDDFKYVCRGMNEYVTIKKTLNIKLKTLIIG